MNKNQKIISSIVIILVAGVGGYFIYTSWKKRGVCKKANGKWNKSTKSCNYPAEISEIVNKAHDNILFVVDKYEIAPSSFPSLDVLSSMLIDKNIALLLEGHTDNQGEDAYNQTLSENRAKAIKDYLISKGVPSGTITTKGYGESKPIASNDTSKGRTLNRRVEFII
jgi:outer membrane protein OmpA-like peptidoglycan-associated protein